MILLLPLTQQFSLCGARLCAKHQPQRDGMPNRFVLSGRAAAGRDDTAALRGTMRTPALNHSRDQEQDHEHKQELNLRLLACEIDRFTEISFKEIVRLGICVLLAWSASVLSVSASGVDSDDALLNQWLNAQTNLVSWSSDFVQIRKFPTLTKPLETVGRISFKAPHSFRWQLGEPVRTVAVRHEDELMIYYPRLKRAERYSLSAESKGPWKDAMNLLDAGFPRSRADLESRFVIIDMKTKDGIGQLELRPRNQRVRRMLAKVGLEFDAQVLDMKATEVEFADGSTIRTEYRKPSSNPDLPDTVFHLDLPSDVRVSESAAQ